ncbi:MAG: amidohydrolase [Anaerolineae bacterium]|nr:amidohydrolase [Anaerolineae bacterium]
MKTKSEDLNIVQSKRDILNMFPELELTGFGDFAVRKEYVQDYEIIDFHTHTFPSVSGMLPALFRRELDDGQASFFDLSCYPGSVSFFNFSKVGYRCWPESFWSFPGLKTAFDLLGFNGVITLVRKAGNKRLLRDMELGNISYAVVLPINSIYVDSTSLLLDSISGYERLIPFASLHPLESDIEVKIKTYVSKGVRGFKINPHIQAVDFDDEKMIDLVKRLAETRLPIISCSGLAVPPHYLGQAPKFLRRSVETQNLNRYEKVLCQIPDHPFVFAHGGVEQNEELIVLMKKFPNTLTDISTQNSDNIKRLIEEVGSQRLLFGSDYPFFNQAFPIVSVLRATDNQQDRTAIFSENARKLLNLSQK